MSAISQALALETAETWETMAEMEKDSSPGRRETLRECADLLRMLAGRKFTSCPHGGVFHYCEFRPENVAECPIGLPTCLTFSQVQQHRRERR